ncbi:MAG: acetylglutamate kinase [Chloroflexi bacterium]|nr:acetylglutamate kinase [Chloroflexota bacterium]MDA1145063.1 acetylglutamate kinase [Chloroflexota bacterium]MQC82948.1 acetylglutamate kinase [Chloroflexota bacterium]PKB56439.1 MAG: acetylglutamate kinase [SAR202 cluster bacterium Casp-Chloro-G1]
MTVQAAGITVVKIGGSTLGAEDTTLEDVVALAREGHRPLVVHGGGAMISSWLERMAIEAVFVDGLRATNADALDVVVGVLRGVVNARLVAQIVELGGRAIGVSGIDGGSIHAERYDERLGFVGRVTGVDASFFTDLIDAGVIPVVAPIGLERPSQPLNINADTVAGELARAVHAERLLFMTDVDGLLDGNGELIATLDAQRAATLRQEGVLTGGMIPKVDACLRAAETGTEAFIANGTLPGTVRRLFTDQPLGTRVGER